jgi:predicted ATPase with chaperone activity
VGASMLARRLTTILPAMRLAEALETTCIHRVAGLSGDVSLVHYSILRLDELSDRSCTHAVQRSD